MLNRISLIYGFIFYSDMNRIERPRRILLLGHSYIRRLREYEVQHTTHRNLGFPPSDMFVRYVSRGGGHVRRTADDRSMYSYMTEAASMTPDIVYLHVGENDLRVLTAVELADAIEHYIATLTAACRPRYIIVSQLLCFPQNSDFIDRVGFVNRRLEAYARRQNARGASQIVVWKHRIGVWGRGHEALFVDGVHLNSVGMARYWHSVRTVVGRVVHRLHQ
jgi:hypothetical protein